MANSLFLSDGVSPYTATSAPADGDVALFSTALNAWTNSTAPAGSGDVTASGTLTSNAVILGGGSAVVKATGTGVASAIAFTGSANVLTVSGATATNPVTLTATGSDSAVEIRLIPKGAAGFVSLGPSTYGISGWAGEPVALEVYDAASPASLAPYGIYVELQTDDSDSSGLGATAGVQPGFFSVTANGVNFNQGLIKGVFAGANSSMGAGRTITLVTGIQGNAYNSDAGTVTQAAGVDGYFEQSGAGLTGLGVGVRAGAGVSAGTVTSLYHLMVEQSAITGGTVTTHAGIHVGNITGGTTNYAIRTLTGLIAFGDDIQMADGQAFGPDTTTAHTALLRAYDVNGTTYRTFGTLTNGDVPDFTIAPPSGGTVTLQASTFKSSDGSTGATGTATGASTLTIKNGLVTNIA